MCRSFAVLCAHIMLPVTRITPCIEMGNRQPYLFIWYLATKALEDRLQISGAKIVYSFDNRSICLRADPRLQSLWAMILNELCEVAPSRAEAAAGSPCDLFHTGAVGEQFKGRLFHIVRLAGPLGARTAADGRVQWQAVGTTISGNKFEETVSKIGELAFADAANPAERG